MHYIMSIDGQIACNKNGILQVLSCITEMYSTNVCYKLPVYTVKPV